MKNTIPLDAATLLNLTVQQAGAVFGATPQERKTAYRRLVQAWHPDHSPHPQAQDVFIHIRKLYESLGGKRQIRPQPMEFVDTQGRIYRYQPQQAFEFELGQWWRGKASLAYRTDVSHAPLHAAFARIEKQFSFANNEMRKQMAPFLPSLHASMEGPQGGLLVVKRDPKGILLRDVHNHYQTQGMSLDPRHVGWIISALHNAACYLSFCQLAHHGLNLDTVWVNPHQHSVEILGGWFYATRFGEGFNRLPAQAGRFASQAYLREKIASQRLDLECIRGIGRTLLGDASGLRFPAATPQPLIDALRLPASKTAVEEYRQWKQALQAAFGAPKFVPMQLSFNDVYQGE